MWEAGFLYLLYFLIHRYTDLVTRPHIVRRTAKGAWMKFTSIFKRTVSKRDFVNGDVEIVDYSSIFLALLGTIATGGAAVAVGRHFFGSSIDQSESKTVKVATETQGHSTAHINGKGEVTSSDPIKTVEIIEEKIDAGLELKRLNNSMLGSFNVWDMRYSESTSTSSSTDFSSRCMRNIRFIAVHTGKKSESRLRIGHRIILCNNESSFAVWIR
jgi:hypothetical protein